MWKYSFLYHSCRYDCGGSHVSSTQPKRIFFFLSFFFFFKFHGLAFSTLLAVTGTVNMTNMKPSSTIFCPGRTHVIWLHAVATKSDFQEKCHFNIEETNQFLSLLSATKMSIPVHLKHKTMTLNHILSVQMYINCVLDVRVGSF